MKNPTEIKIEYLFTDKQYSKIYVQNNDMLLTKILNVTKLTKYNCGTYSCNKRIFGYDFTFETRFKPLVDSLLKTYEKEQKQIEKLRKKEIETLIKKGKK